MTAAPADGSHRDAVPWRFILPPLALAAMAVAAYVIWLPAGSSRFEATWSGPVAGAVLEYDGFEHCGTEDVRFLFMGFSDGHIAAYGEPAVRRLAFARNAEAAKQRPLPGAGLADLDTELPANAIDTGYHRGARHLYMADMDGLTAIYVVTRDRVERWPQSDSACD